MAVIVTKEYYCDICKKKYDGQNEKVVFSVSSQDFSGIYVGGQTYEFKEVCNDCTHKIKDFVFNRLSKKNL